MIKNIQMTRLILMIYVIHMVPIPRERRIDNDALRSLSVRFKKSCEVRRAEEEPHVTSLLATSRPPAAKKSSSSDKYKDFAPLALLFIKASKRSEPATTYACAPHPVYPGSGGILRHKVASPPTGGRGSVEDFLLDYRKPAFRLCHFGVAMGRGCPRREYIPTPTIGSV